MVSQPSRRVTRGQLRLQGQATQQQRARLNQRAAVVAALGRVNAPPLLPRELRLAAPVYTRELVRVRIGRLQAELTQHQAHLSRLEAAPLARDPKAGIANPLPPYTPCQQPWDSTVRLWEAANKLNGRPLTGPPLSKPLWNFFVTEFSAPLPGLSTETPLRCAILQVLISQRVDCRPLGAGVENR